VADDKPPGAPTIVAAAPSQPGDDLLGSWACSFRALETNTQYPPMSCEITRRTDSTLWLEKTSGSQRIRGTVTPTDDGFRFSGSSYCPFGSGGGPVGGTFVRGASGALAGTVTGRGCGVPVRDRVVLTRRGTGGHPAPTVAPPPPEPTLSDLGL